MQNTSVGNIIKQVRKEKNMTQRQLADKLKISDKTVSKWERGLGCPEVSLLNDLAEILGLDLASLLAGSVSSEDFVGGNMKNTKFHICPICHNITLCTGKAEISCCGRRVPEEVLQKADEENKLFIETIDGEWHVTSNHEMKKENYISFVATLTGDNLTVYKQYPEWDLSVRVPKKRFGKLVWFSTTKGLYYQLVK